MKPTTKKRVVTASIALILAAAIFLGVTALSVLSPARRGEDPGSAISAQFVGSQSCAACHAAQFAQWQLSHHRHAMEPASEQTVLGDFDNVVLSYFGRRTRFSRNGSQFQVRTENQQGKTEAFTVAYTLGYKPLQQYLVELDKGRIQALPFAWDTRAQEEGGQRWFHLYPEDDIRPDDPLFWTRPQQNWNHMCGDCHTTNFAKRFSDADSRFESRWSELGNGCESCHGAGSVHVASMQASSAHAPRLSISGLHGQAEQLDQCGACHARRGRLQENPSRDKLLQTWRPELLLEGMYFVDGQIRDEVFEIGSFLQSKMAAKGVTCTDCHDPHATTLKAEGNGLCTRCHERGAYDTEQHHFHPVGTNSAQCVNCHMPARTYMVVDSRRDHRFSIPRQDLSEALDTPNVCLTCHQEQTHTWAAEKIRQQVMVRAAAKMLPDTFGTALWQARNEQMAAAASLRAVIDNPSMSSIARATALVEMGRYVTPDSLAVIQSQLRAADPLIRLGAVQALSGAPAPLRRSLLIDHLRDQVLAVRLAIAPLLAGSDKAGLTVEQRQQLENLFAEYRRWLTANSDRAEALVALAGFDLAEGDVASAQASLEKALQRDETSLVAHLNYADYHRSANNDREAEKLLRKARALYPDSADAHLALGLLLVRQKRVDLALPELLRAMELVPRNSYYAYVYAVGLYSSGKTQQALSVLTEAQARFPASGQIQAALQSYCTEQRGQIPRGVAVCN